MSQLDLTSLSIPDAKLIQQGLKAVGFYEGTTRGLPGPKTLAAYQQYLASFLPAADPENPATPAGELSLGDRLVEVLLTKVGVREIPKDSNRGKEVQEFQSATWLEGTGWPWCAAFVCWGMLKVQEQVNYPFKRPRTAAAWGFEQWARDEGLLLMKPRKKIKKGDIVMFTFSHIGVAIEDEVKGYVATVEGNTNTSGSREGGGVYRTNRKTSLIRSHVRLEAKA